MIKTLRFLLVFTFCLLSDFSFSQNKIEIDLNSKFESKFYFSDLTPASNIIHPPVASQLAEPVTANTISFQSGNLTDDSGILNKRASKLFGLKRTQYIRNSAEIAVSLSKTDIIYPFHAFW